MNSDAKALILLASSVINHEKTDSSVIDSVNFDDLYKIAVFHNMTAIVSTALETADIADDRFKQEKAKAVRRILLFDNERQAVTEALRHSRIWYMPLKGVILKDYYPEIGLRQMSDNDILFDVSRADDVKQIMESLGFTTVHFGTEHQDDYQKAPICHFEMHRMLFAPTSDERLYKYYRNVENKLIKSSDYERQFTNEDFYIYLVAHEYKHFYWNGTGLRSLLDIYVFLKKFYSTLDWKYIKMEVKKIGIADFEKKNRHLAGKVFSGNNLDKLSPDEAEMLDYFITAGTYGTRKRGIQNNVEKAGSFRYVLERVFMPMRGVKVNYPFFYRHRVLLPVLPLYRLLKGWKNALREIFIVMKK